MNKGTDLNCKVLQANRDGRFDTASTGDYEATFENTLDNTQTEAERVR
jgi:hypothetical protein